MTLDPTRILELAQTLETGSSEDKLKLLSELSPSDPLTSGILMRALDDSDPAVRMGALQRLAEANTRPIDPVLSRLLNDPDPEIRALAGSLQGQPSIKNPLEELIPMIEGIAGSLGPFGGLLKSMVQTLRDVGQGDEESQLQAIQGLDAANPAAFLAIHQALRSDHASVRTAALSQAVALPDITVPEEVVAHALADPDEAVRGAAEAAVSAGVVGPFDDDSFRQKAMQSMLGSLTGGAGIDFSQFGAMLSGLSSGGSSGGPNLGDLASLFGGNSTGSKRPQPESTPRPASPSLVDPGVPHKAAGGTYIVCNLGQRDRLIRVMGRSCEPGSLIDVSELAGPQGARRWALIPQRTKSATAGWPEGLEQAGYPAGRAIVSGAEVARRISEQSWGAAWADHRGASPITLVFHDGILSRASWGGTSPGTYPDDATLSSPEALLSAFLHDPTDDALANPQEGDEVRQIE